MEAMASGVPVIASAIRGVPELVEHGRTGLLVSHSDAHALAEALMTIYNRPASPVSLRFEAGRKLFGNSISRQVTRAKQKLFEGVAADDQLFETSQRAS